MKKLIEIIGLTVLMALSTIYASAQTSKPADAGSIDVLIAVAPVYGPTARLSKTGGKVELNVQIDPNGLVTSFKIIKGHPVLNGWAAAAALRWKFEPSVDKSIERSVKLTFVFHILPDGASSNELVTVFKPPYQVEITATVPPSRANY